jgi:hypothetical protein
MEGVNQGLLDAARSGDIEKLQVASCVLIQIGLSRCTPAIRERKWPSLAAGFAPDGGRRSPSRRVQLRLACSAFGRRRGCLAPRSGSTF